MSLTNPILSGFHPDPCLLRVDDTVYLASSTFEWWPGVQLHRSQDLSTWEMAGHLLTRPSQLSMRGNPDSGGVWAPALSFCEGTFYLVYSDVKNFGGIHKDLANYYVTAPSIEGPWSDPIYLNRSGFDPSLFHDDDGRSWLLNQLWDHRPDRHAFAGIVLQEMDRASGQLLGSAENIFRGSPLRFTEGPHLYKREGCYYLVTAEGGTGRDHAVTVARSRTLQGPYELSPHHPMLTSRYDSSLALQNAGHGSWVEMPDGRWFMAHLCVRPIGPHGRSILGRETALQEFTWTEDGWPRLISRRNIPATTLSLPPSAQTAEAWSDDFAGPTLSARWNTLREPATPDWLQCADAVPGLTLRGRLSLSSAFDQSLVATRLQHHRCVLETWLEFEPTSFQQMAGLALYYNTSCYHYLHLTHDESKGKCVQILTSDARQFQLGLETPVAIGAEGPIGLRAVLELEVLRFYFSSDGETWDPLGEALDATILSDEYISESGLGFGFTGTFVALACQDLSGAACPARYLNFHYTPRD